MSNPNMETKVKELLELKRLGKLRAACKIKLMQS